MLTTEQIQDEVRRLLQEVFSGGVKFTELIAHLTRLRYEDTVSRKLLLSNSDFIKQVESAIGGMEDVGELEYGWAIGPVTMRSKLFIYHKLWAIN